MAVGTSLKLVPVQLDSTTDISEELEKPGVPERLAKGFRWYASALDNVVEDGVFLLRHPDVVFLLDLDVLRAFLSPSEQRGDVAGLVTAFLRHSSVRYAIPSGCFDELLDWLTPLRHLLLDLKSAWSEEGRSTIEARLKQFIGIELSNSNSFKQIGTPVIDEVFQLANRLEALLDDVRFEGFAEDFDIQLADSIQSQICSLRNCRSADGQPHDKRDKRDAANIAIAKNGRLRGNPIPLVLVSRTREVADLANLLEEEGIGSAELAEDLNASDLDDFGSLDIYPVLGTQRLVGLWSAGYFNNPSGTINEAQLLASLCRGVTDKIMSQSVFREIAARRGNVKGETAISNRERPAIVQTFEDVVQHYVNGKLELSRIAQIERAIGSATADSTGDRADQILGVLSRVARKLLGRGHLEYVSEGDQDFCSIQINRIFNNSRPLHVAALAVYHSTENYPLVSLRWPVACNEFRFFEVLNTILSSSVSNTDVFDPFVISDSTEVPESAVIFHTNLGAVAISAASFISEGPARAKFPSRSRLLKLLNYAKLTPQNSTISKQRISDIRQITILTPLGDVRFDIERVGLNEDRFISILRDQMEMTDQFVYLMQETAIWWIEPAEARQIIPSALRKAKELLGRSSESYDDATR